MSYVTNPIANRLGIQQGWYNPLISLRSGLTHISFITYLKCYLLIQEYLRHNQINLIFFEVKPLQKNKKIIHLFVYKNVLHLDKDELTFDSRKDLTTSGFLQLSTYLSQRRITPYKLPLKRSCLINYYSGNNKGKEVALQAIIKANCKGYLKKFKYAKYHSEQISMKIQSARKLVGFSKQAKLRPNIDKNDRFYNKKRLLRKIVTIRRLQYKNLKKLKNKNKKKWFRKRKYFRNRDLEAQLLSNKINKMRKKIFAKKHRKMAIKAKLGYFNKKFLRVRTLLPKAYREEQKVTLHHSQPFINTFNKLQLKRNKKKIKLNTLNLPKQAAHYPVKKRKIFRIQNQVFTTKLRRIRNSLSVKLVGEYSRNLLKIYYLSKKSKKIRYNLWRKFLSLPLMPKLAHLLIKFVFMRNNFQSELWRCFEENKVSNPFRFIFSTKSYISRTKRYARNNKLAGTQFKCNYDGQRKLQLAWKNRFLYDLKSQTTSKPQEANDRLAFTSYMGFINTYCRQQKSLNLRSNQILVWKKAGKISKKGTKSAFYFRYFNTQFQKLSLEFKFLIEKYVQQYLRFPVLVKIKNISDLVDINATLHQKSSRSDKQKQLFLKTLSRNTFFIRLRYTILNSERLFNPQLIIDLIAAEMQKTNNYRKLVYNMVSMFSILRSDYIIGYKILIDGKLGGSKRKTTKQIFKSQRNEKIPIQTFTKNISYALGVARTPAGLFGIRMWLYY